MTDPNWTGRTPRTMRHDYAHCGYVYKPSAGKRALYAIAQWGALVMVFAGIGVLMAWRG